MDGITGGRGGSVCVCVVVVLAVAKWGQSGGCQKAGGGYLTIVSSGCHFIVRPVWVTQQVMEAFVFCRITGHGVAHVGC